MMTREEAIKRFRATKRKKQEYVTKLEAEMKASYEQRTGLKANYFSVL